MSLYLICLLILHLRVAATYRLVKASRVSPIGRLATLRLSCANSSNKRKNHPSLHLAIPTYRCSLPCNHRPKWKPVPSPVSWHCLGTSRTISIKFMEKRNSHHPKLLKPLKFMVSCHAHFGFYIQGTACTLDPPWHLDICPLGIVYMTVGPTWVTSS